MVEKGLPTGEKAKKAWGDAWGGTLHALGNSYLEKENARLHMVGEDYWRHPSYFA